MKRPTSPLFPPRIPKVELQHAVVVLFGLVAACGGCGRPDSIERYTVEKPPAPRTDDPSSSRPGAPPAPDRADAAPPSNLRLLGALLPRGSRCWFFKVVGPADAVAPHVDAFADFVGSIRFDESGTDDTPSWNLPDGWQQAPGSGMRLATIRLDESATPLEMSVIPLAAPEMDEEAYVLFNVNRWRGQVGEGEIDASRLAEFTRRVALDGATATIVDVAGSPDSERMPAPPMQGPQGDGDDD